MSTLVRTAAQIRASIGEERDRDPDDLDPDDDLLRPSEVAQILNVSPQTVWRFGQTDRLPYVRIGGGHRRYPASAVKAFAETRPRILPRPARHDSPAGAPTEAYDAATNAVPAVPAVTAVALPHYARLAADAERYINGHLGEPISVDQLAAAAGYSKYHFTRAFTAATGRSPGRHVTARRMEQAAHLLATTDASVAEVCSKVGFSSIGSFSTAFAAWHGLPPTQYRAQQRDDDTKIPARQPTAGWGAGPG